MRGVRDQPKRSAQIPIEDAQHGFEPLPA